LAIPVPLDAHEEGWEKVNDLAPYFHEIMSALQEYQRREKRRLLEGFVMTAPARKIFETLDIALQLGRIAVIEGVAGGPGGG
jgi:FPC/CPF motif-containing protein YcgG